MTMAARPSGQTSFEPIASSDPLVLEELNANGVVRINNVIQDTRPLLAYVHTALEQALAEAENELSMDFGGASASISRFGNVMARTQRHDLKLDLTPLVKAAIAEMLESLGPVFSTTLGGDAELYELAALISKPGAPGQPIHPDTPHRDGQGVAALTAFIALQDIDRTMGPTLFVPGTQTAEAHATFNTKDDSGEAMTALLRSRPSWRGLLKAGDATLFDSRLLHCGCANESQRWRVLFYASFRAKGATLPPGTLLYDLRGRHGLAELCS